MGRKKIAMQRIENDAARLRKYRKRLHGLLKKAHEIGVLCGADVLLMVALYGSDPDTAATTLVSCDRYCTLPDETAFSRKCVELSRGRGRLPGHRYAPIDFATASPPITPPA